MSFKLQLVCPECGGVSPINGVTIGARPRIPVHLKVYSKGDTIYERRHLPILAWCKGSKEMVAPEIVP
jgi:hypothetical protein